MSIESLKANKTLSWVDTENFKKGEFGPPVFDENQRTYKWR